MLLAFVGCANIKAPSGGPDDKLLPEIVSFYPPENSLNFSNFPIVLEFSEYVDKSSVVDNIRINPEVKLKYSWKGKKLRITPATTEALKPNTTYCLSVDPAFKDQSGNIPARGFSLIFSTGGDIDSCAIAGQVFEKAEGYTVLCYSLKGLKADTLDSRHTKATAKTKIGTSGKFAFKALTAGDYRVLLINDKNSDGIYNEESEEFSAATKDVHLAQNGISDWLTFFSATVRDVVPPAINKATATDCRTVKITFTEAIKIDSANSHRAIALLDSTGREIPLLAVFRSDKDTSCVFIISAEQMHKSALYKVRIAEEGISDIAGNTFSADARISDAFIGSDDERPAADTDIKPTFKEALCGDGFVRSVELAFPAPLLQMPEPLAATLTVAKTGRTKQIVFADSVSDDINQVPMKLAFLNRNKLVLKPDFALSDFTTYSLSLQLKNIKTCFGETLPDTTIKTDFTTADTRFYGSVSGSIKDTLNSVKTDEVIVTAKSASNGKTYFVKTDSQGNWTFAQLPADDYVLRVFLDANHNGRFDYGRAMPFEHSEKYCLTERKVSLPKRWKVENVILNISGAGK